MGHRGETGKSGGRGNYSQEDYMREESIFKKKLK